MVKRIRNVKSYKRIKPEIYRYHDYRSFLKDWLVYLKASQSEFSMRKLSEKAGISVSNLSMILSGRRKLSHKSLDRLSPVVQLNFEEREYLRLLVDLGDSNTPETRVEAYNQMKQSRNYQNLNPKEVEVFRYLTHWYYVAIREMSVLPEFSLDSTWIQEKLMYSVGLKEIEKALKFLLEYKYIQLDSDGKVSSPQQNLDCKGGIYRLSLAQFHREMLSMASKSIDAIPREKRNILGYTLPIEQKDFEKVSDILNRAYEELKALAKEQKGGDSVYHVEMALFPLTKG